jgi:hypothetical protein
VTEIFLRYSHLSLYYRAQVKAIKSALPDIRVSTVDSFQGQESDFVVFSAVRAGSSHIGFLKDMQRLNVAITRAKHALIIVCDVRTMETNEGWRSLIRSANVRGLLSHVPVASNGPFKQQVETFLSKPSPFAVYDQPTSQKQKPQKAQNPSMPAPNSTSDPRLQPTLRISSYALPLPPSMQASPVPSTNEATSAPPLHVSPGAQHGSGTASRPPKRAASPPKLQTLPQSQHQQLLKPSLQRPGEQRVAERAIAEQERRKLIQDQQQDILSAVSSSQHEHHPHQSQQNRNPKQQSLPIDQPAVKRERIHDPPPQGGTKSSVHSGAPVFSPSVYKPPVIQSSTQATHSKEQFSKHPPPPPNPPPEDLEKSPLKEQVLAVERLFAVPVLCSCVIFLNSVSLFHVMSVISNPFNFD